MLTKNRIISAVQRALLLDPKNIDLRLHLIFLHIEEKQFQEALFQCQFLLQEQPGQKEARELSAQIKEQLFVATEKEAENIFSFEKKAEQKLTRDSNSEKPGQDIETDVKSKGTGTEKGKGSVIPFHAKEKQKNKVELWEVEKPQIRLVDVGGMEEVKRRLNLAFLAPLQNPELRKMYAKSLRGGLLLWGPPGCGKTMIARATAGELGARFLAVGLDDILSSYQGGSEQNLHAIFETARRNAPCLLFFDEVDALGHKRSELRGSESRNLVVQLLDEMDGVDSQNEGVFVLAATNQPWDVDPALRRPGRFDRMLLVLPPDEEARKAILALHFRERPVGPDLDIAEIVLRTEGYSGADLAQICETASEFALEQALVSGTALPITMDHIRLALKEVSPSTTSWLQLAKTYAQFAAEGNAYDDLLTYLRTRA